MLRPYMIPVWKRAPFVRLLLPLITGILLQWYLQFSLTSIIGAFIAFSIAFVLFLFLPLAARFTLKPLQGTSIQLMLVVVGAWLTWQNDVKHHNYWYGHYYRDSSYLLVKIGEPLVEKNKTYKAEGFVESVISNNQVMACSGKLLLYFSKDSLAPVLNYGDRIILRKNLQPIKNSGNPGAFNYQRYAAFQGIFHNVFLKEKDWTLLQQPGANKPGIFKKFIFSARETVLSTLRENIQTGKDELGIAQALLIGYTNDLDKDLVQAYSNTGVVHIIAVSGMHLALIYVLLTWIFAKVPVIKRSKVLQLVLVLTCLWLFALVTGASASVLRAAVMFTFIAIGKQFFKETSIYNSLAASAFILLCYNPYYLWSVGFQLSYLAVLGIVIFQKPVYNCVYIKNKWLDKVWQLTAVSTAAQLLTFPVCIYYFHQFPNLFLITNLVAVPLSAVILYAAIALAALAWIPFAGVYLGKLVGGLTWLMNTFILWVNGFSFAVWDRIPATVLSTWLLYATLIACSAWLLLRNKKYLIPALGLLMFFILVGIYDKWRVVNQQKIIIYNVPQQQAIDFVWGNRYRFLGDSILAGEGGLPNFHLKPARIANQLLHPGDSLPGIFANTDFFQYGGKRIFIPGKAAEFETPPQPIDIDLLVLSKNTRLNLSKLTGVFKCKQVVADASNSSWRIEKWKEACRLLNIKFYSIPAEGAYIYNIDP